MKNPILTKILDIKDLDLNQKLDRSNYKLQMKKLKERIRIATLYAKQVRRSIVFVFEGWDAAGKGGAIRRLTEEIDPTLYTVHSIAAPSSEEKLRHYLWRFWNRIPGQGLVGIFDRSWYGRVLVERIEGFATEGEWKRSFEEIVRFEEQLINDGAIVIKFWLHIDSDEQLKRFDYRKNDPLKRWKLTDEDYRNRDKWENYEVAANEMFLKTDHSEAPWILVPANDKYFARCFVLAQAVNFLESKLNIPKKFK
ncbi:UDP-galactose-lipid carrier transferase [Leptospira ilyithenensis]|uniref:UDP-galactose-lipid carrier transferase n=1 Tax=Leptospira ilyithenensis TaxID=2484901 RepID=A0A4R9LTV5_9LEPT|nr:UDP-galactose-lipid carrier transferase [Leptospira ilyithenensis]TGN13998.1 UDP-galactose-lipid carrier transferase [Leptospira ilyithenensis]